jgi:hypothetical protein
MGRMTIAVLSALFLAACLVLPVLHFLGTMRAQEFKALFLLVSLGWFICASFWRWGKKRRKS